MTDNDKTPEDKLEEAVDRLTVTVRQIIQQRDELAEATEFLLSFVPEWAKDVPEGLGETFYGTLSAEGDRAVKTRVDQARVALARTRDEAAD